MPKKCPIILMNSTIKYLFKQEALGDNDAIEVLKMSDTMNIEKRENYVVLTDKENDESKIS